MNFDIGIFGLGVMGKSLSLNFEGKGYHVAGYDISSELLDNFTPHVADLNIQLFNIFEDFINSLKSPKIILLMIKSGKPVDESLTKLLKLVNESDIIIDGGNSHYKDTMKRYDLLKSKKIHYFGLGVSGGEEGARNGPSLMLGGDIKIWETVKPLFQSIAAVNNDGTICCKWLGPNGAGHFVKMVHNGIEYALMQAISEVYDIFKNGLNYKTTEISSIFQDWNNHTLESYLLEITSKILMKEDENNENLLINNISDVAGQKGTGNWSAKASLEYNFPGNTIIAAVYQRNFSGLIELRKKFQKMDKDEYKTKTENKINLDTMYNALYLTSIIIYAQGFELLKVASLEHHWELNLKDISSIWRSGCIIRSSILDKMHKILIGLETELIYEHYENELISLTRDLRRVIINGINSKLPVPVLSSTITFIDSLNQHRLSTYIIQAQRDFFGSHGYQRNDSNGQFHTNW